MNDKKKNNKNWVKGPLIFLFVIFITLYISQITGYYEFDQYKRTRLTEEKIKSFEKDIKAGKKINLSNYIDSTKKNYNNNISKSGLRLSNILDEAFTTTMNVIAKIFEGLFG
jgi:hypothetical protein